MNTRITCAALALGWAIAASACQLDDDSVDSNESALTLNGGISSGVTFSIYAPDRLLWQNTSRSAKGSYWGITKTGGTAWRFSLSGASGARPVGAAGDRVLWYDASHDITELHTVDAGGKVTAVHQIAKLVGFQPVSLSLAAPLYQNCYDRGAEQDYYVMYNGPESFAVVLVDGAGYVRRTSIISKPYQQLGLQAIWFGVAADGYEWAMFRGNTTAYRFRADWSPAQGNYIVALGTLRTSSLSGFQPVGMTARPLPKRVLSVAWGNASSWNDYVLYTNNGQARVALFNQSGRPITSTLFGNTANVVWSFANSSYAATAYAYVPPVCN